MLGENAMEFWDLLDDNGTPLGRTIERGKRLRSGENHLVVHIWVVNSVGRYLIQRRSPHLKLMPNVWAVTSGSAIAGEDSLTAAKRELSEELGVSASAEKFSFLGRLKRRNSFCDIWLLQKDVAVPDLTLQKEEVAEARWVSKEQLLTMLDDRRFHHYGSTYFRFLFEKLDALKG